jgi:hypothetical protein
MDLIASISDGTINVRLDEESGDTVEVSKLESLEYKFAFYLYDLTRTAVYYKPGS